MTMFVVKRDGKRQSCQFDKIQSRISKLCYGLDQKVSYLFSRSSVVVAAQRLGAELHDRSFRFFWVYRLLMEDGLSTPPLPTVSIACVCEIITIHAHIHTYITS